jgi:ribonuclease M5
MRRLKEVIVVEGRYDKNTLSQVVDAVIITVNGFSVFKDKEKVALLRRLGAERGLIVLTDSDGAGFVIRNHLRGILPKEQVKHAYIPDICGKERRKRTAGKEGKLGVEGMSPEVLIRALEQAGATFADEPDTGSALRQAVTKADFFELGLSGGVEASARRKVLLKRLEFPERMTANALLEAVNVLYTREEFLELAGETLSRH